MCVAPLQAIPPLIDTVYFKWRVYYEEAAEPTTRTSSGEAGSPKPSASALAPRETHHIEWQFGYTHASPNTAEGGS